MNHNYDIQIKRPYIYNDIRPKTKNLGQSDLPKFISEIDSFFDDPSVMIVTIAILIMIGYMSSK